MEGEGIEERRGGEGWRRDGVKEGREGKSEGGKEGGWRGGEVKGGEGIE